MPVQHSPMSPEMTLVPVFVIVEPASSANESAVPSGTGDAASALPASAGLTMSARARAGAAATALGRRRFTADMHDLRRMRAFPLHDRGAAFRRDGARGSPIHRPRGAGAVYPTLGICGERLHAQAE